MILALALAGAAVSSPAKPIDPITWVTNDDYPPEALRKGWEGVTQFELSIDSSGAVGACKVVVSSGYPILDQQTCLLMQTRGHFEPARDAQGAATSATFAKKIRWQIPREGPTRMVRIDPGPMCSVEGALKLTTEGCMAALDLARRLQLNLPAVLPLPVPENQLILP